MRLPVDSAPRSMFCITNRIHMEASSQPMLCNILTTMYIRLQTIQSDSTVTPRLIAYVELNTRIAVVGFADYQS